MKRILSRTIFILTMHCDAATRLASDSLDRPLPFHERWALRLHVLICWSCRHFARQVRLVHDACRHAQFPSDVDGLLKTIQLDDEVKRKLRGRMKLREEKGQ